MFLFTIHERKALDGQSFPFTTFLAPRFQGRRYQGEECKTGAISVSKVYITPITVYLPIIPSPLLTA